MNTKILAPLNLKNDIETVGELIAALRQFDRKARIRVSVRGNNLRSIETTIHHHEQDRDEAIILTY